MSERKQIFHDNRRAVTDQMCLPGEMTEEMHPATTVAEIPIEEGPANEPFFLPLVLFSAESPDDEAAGRPQQSATEFSSVVTPPALPALRRKARKPGPIGAG